MALARTATGYSKKKAQQMVQSRAIQTTLIATISIFALTIAAVGQALGESSLDTSYIVSFARVPVGEITASLVVGNTEYKMSARGRAGGIVKVLLDGEGSFITQGTNVDGRLGPRAGDRDEPPRCR
jgi:streptogramin lyase